MAITTWAILVLTSRMGNGRIRRVRGTLRYDLGLGLIKAVVRRTSNFVPVSALDKRRPPKVALIRGFVRQAEESEPGQVRTPKKKKASRSLRTAGSFFFTATEAGASVCAPGKARNLLAALASRG